MNLEHDKQVYQLSARTLLRRIQQPDRVIYLESSLISVASDGLTFFEDCVYIVRRPASVVSLSASESLLLGWHRSRAVQNGQPSLRSLEAIDSLKERVAGLASIRVEYHLQTIRNGIQGTQYDDKPCAYSQVKMPLACRADFET